MGTLSIPSALSTNDSSEGIEDANCTLSNQFHPLPQKARALRTDGMWGSRTPPPGLRSSRVTTLLAVRVPDFSTRALSLPSRSSEACRRKIQGAPLSGIGKMSCTWIRRDDADALRVAVSAEGLEAWGRLPQRLWCWLRNTEGRPSCPPRTTPRVPPRTTPHVPAGPPLASPWGHPSRPPGTTPRAPQGPPLASPQDHPSRPPRTTPPAGVTEASSPLPLGSRASPTGRTWLSRQGPHPSNSTWRTRGAASVNLWVSNAHLLAVTQTGRHPSLAVDPKTHPAFSTQNFFKDVKQNNDYLPRFIILDHERTHKPVYEADKAPPGALVNSLHLQHWSGGIKNSEKLLSW